MDEQTRFLKFSYQTENCWFWLGSRTAQGYGKFFFNGKLTEAHRAAFMLFRGEIPAGFQVLHRCDIKQCVNPEHLSLGTGKDNVRDAISKGAYGGGVQNLFKTHCPHGHVLDESNIKPTAKGWRGCKTCNTARMRASRAAKRAALATLESRE